MSPDPSGQSRNAHRIWAGNLGKVSQFSISKTIQIKEGHKFSTPQSIITYYEMAVSIGYLKGMELPSPSST